MNERPLRFPMILLVVALGAACGGDDGAGGAAAPDGSVANGADAAPSDGMVVVDGAGGADATAVADGAVAADGATMDAAAFDAAVLDAGTARDGGRRRDSGVARDGSIRRDASTVRDASIGRDASIVRDASIGRDATVPPPRELPDISDIRVDCSRLTLSDLVRAREIYDETFGDHLPATDREFGWHSAGGLVTAEKVDRIAFYALPSGLADQTYHDYFDFNPHRYERSTSATNFAIFAGVSPGDSYQAFRRYNPQDWIPATATHYGRGTTTDITATQLVYRIGCYRDEMAEAFARCPDCVDVFTALSRNDLYKIFEVRFVRVVADALQVSRPFKMISVDASGHMFMHATTNRNRYSFARLGSDYLYAYWRVELSGRMAQNLGTYGHPTAILVRSLPINDYPSP